MSFRSLAQEATLINTLVATGRCAVDIIGTSVEGRPIRLLRMGNPPPEPDDRPAILLVGLQHGNEPAGREAILDYADHLSTTADTGELAMLAAHGVHMIPTVNPDRALSERRNANDEDLNRDWVALTQPETRAVTEAIGNLQPRFLADLHEYVGGTSRNDIETNRGGSVQIHGDIIAVGTAVRDAILARATAEGWSNDHWGPDNRGDLIVLDINSSYRHIPAVIVETNRTGTPSEAQRIEMQYAAIEEIVDYVSSNLSSVTSDIDTARAAKAAEGAAGTTPFNVRGGNILDPPPLGYRVTGVVPAFHLQVFGIAISSTGVVTMAQAAQPLIPFLFDPLSETMVTQGIRLFSLDDAVAVATVSELAPIVAGSHDIAVQVFALTSFQVGHDPEGVELPVLSGDVQFDSTAEVHATLSLTTRGVDDSGRSWFPRGPDGLLAPYGNEVFVRRGIDIGGGGVLWSPLGYYRIETVEQGDDIEAPISIQGSDRMAAVVESDVLHPIEFAASTSVASFFAALVGPVHPEAVIVFDDDTGSAPLGRTVVVDEGRYEPMHEVADSFGKVMAFDGEGVLRIESPPADQPVWQVRSGRGGVLVQASRRVSRIDAPNGVIVIGEGGGSDEPVRGFAVDRGPRSPTRWGGRYGRVPHTEQLSTVTSDAQAQSAAVEILRRRLGAPYSADFGTVVNPALRPRMPIRVVWRDNNTDLHVVETLTVPLTADGVMSGTTRERTHIVIGAEVG